MTTSPDSLNLGRSLLHRWELAPDCTFLNHGSFGACPREVLDEQDRLRRELERQPVLFLGRRIGTLMRQVAARLAAYVGAAADDVVWVDNATTGANAVLRSLAFEPGDEIVTTDHVYGAVLRTLEFLHAKHGVTVRQAPVPFPIATGDQVVDALASHLSARTKLVVVDHVTSPTGLVFPVEDIAALCRERGIELLVDGAHAPGMLPLDLARLDVDFYTGNCHKWLFAPKGCAFLWARRDHQPRLHPPVLSHGYPRGFVEEFDWVGTKDPTPWLALPRAMRFHEELGGASLSARNHRLVCEGRTLLAEAWGVDLPAPETMLATLATLPCPIEAPATMDGAAMLNQELWARHRVEVPVIPFGGRLWIRVSAQAYNELEDYERLADVVSTLRKR